MGVLSKGIHWWPEPIKACKKVLRKPSLKAFSCYPRDQQQHFCLRYSEVCVVLGSACVGHWLNITDPAAHNSLFSHLSRPPRPLPGLLGGLVLTYLQ